MTVDITITLVQRIISFDTHQFRRLLELGFVTPSWYDCVRNFCTHMFKRLLPYTPDPYWITVPRSRGARAFTLAVDQQIEWMVESMAKADPQYLSFKVCSDGTTPLFHACDKLLIYSASALLRAGADPDARDQCGWTPLYLSVWANTEKIADIDLVAPFVQLLIDSDADVNARTDRHSTALHCASLHGLAKIVGLLIDAGAEQTVDRDGDAPLHCACSVPMLPSSALAAEMQVQRMSVIKQLLANGADVNAKNRKGYTALSNAVNTHGSVEFVRYLILDGGADVNAIISTPSLKNVSARALAVSKERRDIVQLLDEVAAAQQKGD